MGKIALGALQRFGIIKTKTLLAFAGSVETFFELSDRELAARAGIKPHLLKKFNRKKALERAEQELEFMHKNGIRFHYFQDFDYPSKLKFCDDCPIILYSKGNVDFSRQNIAVVGTRKASSYGKKITQKFVHDLKGRGVQIVSGLAHGIDKEAHEAALKNELPTVAVLGHGLDLIYPAAHRKLAGLMLENGGLITEFMSKTPGDPSHFPRRNRIVAGLSDATVVMESGVKGGSLITARLANEYNREVFAFPGNIERETSIGCNHLIRENKAHLITSAEDMIEFMGWKKITEEKAFQTNLFESLTVDEELLVRLLKHENKSLHVDVLAEQSQMKANELSLHLFNLEMRGVVQSLPGMMYELENGV